MILVWYLDGLWSLAIFLFMNCKAFNLCYSKLRCRGDISVRRPDPGNLNLCLYIRIINYDTPYMRFSGPIFPGNSSHLIFLDHLPKSVPALYPEDTIILCFIEFNFSKYIKYFYLSFENILNIS